jgi:hypothetical protein
MLKWWKLLAMQENTLPSDRNNVEEFKQEYSRLL